jgi:signal transduction histidine kinase
VVNEIFSVINETIDTTRRISHDLLPPTLENFGLKEAIKELCESYQKTESIDLIFELKQQSDQPTDKSVELNLFRILQELIKNSITHGKAQQIRIKLWLPDQRHGTGSPNEIKIDYTDNGKGFEVNDPLHQNGLGMQNIESRLKMIGGNYKLQSQVGAGVKVLITAPQSIS